MRPPARPVTQQVAPTVVSAVSTTNKRRGRTQRPGTTPRFRLSFRPFVRTRQAAEDHVLHFSKSEAGPAAAASPKHASGREENWFGLFLHPLSAKNSSDGRWEGDKKAAMQPGPLKKKKQKKHSKVWVLVTETRYQSTPSEHHTRFG